MAKLSGKWIKVLIDDSGGTVRDVSTDVSSVDIPQDYGKADVTGFMEVVESGVPTIPNMDVELQGKMNPASTVGLFTVIKGINGVYASKTLTIQVGQNATPTTGDPEFEGEFWCSKMSISSTPKGAVELVATFTPYDGSTAPAWGVVG